MHDVTHVDVLIIGAGISGIAAACHLQTRCPDRRFLIVEARERLGGTWDLFRYPGVRSDSDMYTLGYDFKPWSSGKAIAEGADILAYLEETVAERGLAPHIRYRQRVERSDWSSEQQRWTVRVRDAESGALRTVTCSFLFACSGYYRYESGYTPDFPGVERFAGPVIHPQRWPEDLDYTDKRVVVIGSGATAVTLVPAMAGSARHVTMLQRSPTYIYSAPGRDRLEAALTGRLPTRAVYLATRWKNILLHAGFYHASKRFPDRVRSWLLARVRRALGPDYDVGTHFTPDYDPWDQRVCLVPDGDLFEAIDRGDASVVTDHIDTFTEEGIRLSSGRELPADVVVTATGLHVELFSNHAIYVDGRPVVVGDTMTYRAMMLADVPNFAFATGYTNASWTLKVDIVCRYVCRLLNHMERRGLTVVTPESDPTVRQVDLVPLASGYIRRAVDRLPRNGTRHPWRVFEDYLLDRVSLGVARMDDGVLRFERPRPRAGASVSRPFVAKVARRLRRVAGAR